MKKPQLCFFSAVMQSFKVYVCVGVLGSALHHPPNQFGAGRGNYDNFRGHLGGGGGFSGKQRNSR